MEHINRTLKKIMIKVIKCFGYSKAGYPVAIYMYSEHLAIVLTSSGTKCTYSRPIICRSDLVAIQIWLTEGNAQRGHYIRVSLRPSSILPDSYIAKLC